MITHVRITKQALKSKLLKVQLLKKKCGKTCKEKLDKDQRKITFSKMYQKEKSLQKKICSWYMLDLQ